MGFYPKAGTLDDFRGEFRREFRTSNFRVAFNHLIASTLIQYVSQNSKCCLIDQTLMSYQNICTTN